MDAQVDRQEETVPQNETPYFITNALSIGFNFIQTYGWFLLLGLIALVYIKNKLEPSFNKLKKKAEDVRASKKYDAGAAQVRLEAMEAARRRMQEKLDGQAARHAEQMKQKEEQARKEKLEDWERHQEGNGYRSKYRPTETSPSTSASTSSEAKPKKKPLRQSESNPLSGGDSCAWRPGTRRTGGG